MIQVGNNKIGSLYVGSSKIGSAYLGSSLVYQAVAPGYDSYKVHITWNSNDNFNMAGVKIDGVQATTTQISSIWYYNGGWSELSSTDKASAIDWTNNNGKSMYGTKIDINIDEPLISQVQIHTGLWYGGGSMTVNMSLVGVKNDVETELATATGTNSNDKTYTLAV